MSPQRNACVYCCTQKLNGKPRCAAAAESTGRHARTAPARSTCACSASSRSPGLSACATSARRGPPPRNHRRIFPRLRRLATRPPRSLSTRPALARRRRRRPRGRPPPRAVAVGAPEEEEEAAAKATLSLPLRCRHLVPRGRPSGPLPLRGISSGWVFFVFFGTLAGDGILTDITSVREGEFFIFLFFSIYVTRVRRAPLPPGHLA